MESCKICNKPCLFFSFEPISPLLCSLLTQAAKGPCKDGWEQLFFYFPSVNSCEHNCCQSCLRPRSIREIISLRLPCRQPFSSWQAGCCVCCTLPEGGKRVRERSAGPAGTSGTGCGLPQGGCGYPAALVPPRPATNGTWGEAAGGTIEERSLYLLVSSDRCNSEQGSGGAVVNRAVLVQTEMPHWPFCLYVRHVICNKTSKIQGFVVGSKRITTSR